MSTYTVMEHVTDSEWVDIATVTVSPRTKRSSIIRKALEAAGRDPGSVADGLLLRVLDEASAREVPVTTRNRDPEWEIG